MDELVSELYKRHDFFKKANILKSSNDITNETSVNNINKKQERIKTLNKINIKESREYYCHICKTKGHSTNYFKFNLLTKEDNNNKQNRNKNKKYRNNYKNKYHTNIVKNDNHEEYNEKSIDKNGMNDDETYINFLGNISVINNFNHIKNINNENSTHWIIDSGTGINLTNDYGNLKKI